MERDTLLPRAHAIPWMEQPQVQLEVEAGDHPKDEEDIDIAMGGPLTSFKSMLEPDWFINSSIVNNLNPHPPQLQPQQQTRPIIPLPFVSNPTDNNNFLIHHMDSPSFPLDPSSHSHPFSPPKPSFSPFFNNNPFDNAFDFGPDSGFLLNHSSNSPVLMGFSGLNPQPHMGTLELSSGSEFPATRLLPATEEDSVALGAGFSSAGLELEASGGSGNALFLNRGKVLRPLEVLPPVGAPPTLFQKRAALRRGEKSGGLEERLERKRRKSEEREVEEGSIDASGLNYDSDEIDENGKVEENGNNNGAGNFNPNGAVTGGGDRKGKKKGLPAKNLMAERRRRKKLNDRLYMLRSVVPKISKV